jgi:transposase
MGEGKRLSKMEQGNRDLRMVSEYRLGAKKGEIAERHGTHPKTVARAIGRFEEALPEELTGPTKLLEVLTSRLGGRSRCWR